jgi:hypothetical protein
MFPSPKEDMVKGEKRKVRNRSDGYANVTLVKYLVRVYAPTSAIDGYVFPNVTRVAQKAA